MKKDIVLTIFSVIFLFIFDLKKFHTFKSFLFSRFILFYLSYNIDSSICFKKIKKKKKCVHVIYEVCIFHVYENSYFYNCINRNYINGNNLCHRNTYL